MSELTDIQEDPAVTSNNVPPNTQTSPHAPPPQTPKFLENTPAKPRRGSTASRVDIDFFDPPGVRQLQRRLTGLDQVPSSGSSTRAPSPKSDASLGKDFDLKKILENSVREHDAQGLERRNLGVSFENLRVVGVGSTYSYQETLGSLLNPINHIEKIRAKRHPPLHDILSRFEGVVRPGEMLLVLGSPGSGCSTLLKVLANQRDEYHAVEGEVHYDSLSPADVAAHYRGDIVYCPEDDVHFPTLTVGQTLNFAMKTRTPQSRPNVSRPAFREFFRNVLQTVFGLSHVKDTPVGDAAIRGVSGGEKKRVSIAEALAMRCIIGSWDNSTRGLDSSTALEFGRALRIATDVRSVTTIVSIYQASETLYSLFDKVCVIYEGRMAYFGPADQAKQHFIDMGYKPANRQTTPDFLVAATDPFARIPRSDVPNRLRTAAEFARYFLESPMGALNKEDIADYKEKTVDITEKATAFRRSVLAEHSRNTRKSSAYTTSVFMQARAVMQRRVQILKGNPTATIINLISFIVQAVIIGTVFLRMEENTAAYFSRGGVLFFALLFSALSSMTEIPSLFGQRPIILRHQKGTLYHPAIEAVALTVVDIPITLVTLFPFCCILYWVTGLQPSAQQFFIFFLLVFVMSLTMKAWFRTVAAAFKSEAMAQAFSGLILFILVLYTGYTIPKISMIGALRWITYVNPITYGFEALLVNEFHTLKGDCSTLVPQGPGYTDINHQACATIGSVAGQSFVDGNRYVELSFGYKYSNLWRNFGVSVVFGVGFFALLLFFTEYNTSNSYETSRVLFARGTKQIQTKDKAPDEEEVATSQDDQRPDADSEKTAPGPTKMTSTFSWKHVQYTVLTADGPRRLLDDVNGYVAPGKITALMGESGAGKTTLLNVLAQRVNVGVVDGQKLVNGQPLPEDFQAQTGYVQQSDTHVPTDTVREALLMSANLRQPESVPVAEKEAYVNTCLKMCGLEAYANASVGSLGIEHRKRTTIAVELAAKPKLLLFLDEPTSGLDSQSAWAIMHFLRTLADNGQAILCTIHQPSAELFQVFDRLLLLRSGGQTVYFGDLGPNAATLIHYFENHGSRHCEDDENPAEFMLDVIGAGATATSTVDWHDVWRMSSECTSVQREIETIEQDGRNNSKVETKLQRDFATAWFTQFRLLYKREIKFRWRNTDYLFAKYLLNIACGLLIGFTFFKSKESQQGTQNKLFAIYMSSIVCVPLANQLQLPFLNMRNVYEIRERPSKMYSWTALLTAQFLAELPWNMLGSSLYFCCWYFTVGFPADRAAFTYMIFAVFLPLFYTSFATAVASMSPNAEIAGLLYNFLFSFILNFNGVVQPFRLLGWWQWMYHVSPYTYLIEALLGQAIGRQGMACSPVELVHFDPPDGQSCGQYMKNYLTVAGGYLANSGATADCQFCSTATSDEFLLSNFNIQYSNRWRDVALMCAFSAFNIFAIYFLTYFFRIRTTSVFTAFRKRLVRTKSTT